MMPRTRSGGVERRSGSEWMPADEREERREREVPGSMEMGESMSYHRPWKQDGTA